MIETMFDNAELLTNNFAKINLLGTNLVDYSKFMSDTVMDENFSIFNYFLACKGCAR